MTPLTSDARVLTPDGPRYLAAVCDQFEQRARQRPGNDIRVAADATEATIDLGWARCTLHADDTGLALRAEADDQDALEQACELIARHLESHADEPIEVRWSHLGSTDTAAHRRDRMRAFHAAERERRDSHPALSPTERRPGV
jgi:hypothetical protein